MSQETVLARSASTVNEEVGAVKLSCGQTEPTGEEPKDKRRCGCGTKTEPLQAGHTQKVFFNKTPR